MCIKLIDVLSSHTNLIKIRIDTELMTFLCSSILPRPLPEQAKETVEVEEEESWTMISQSAQ